MTRVVLVSWDEDDAGRRADELRRSGFTVEVHSDRRANPRALAGNPPDAFLIDLSRAPSQGRELGGWLRRNRATRLVPLAFVGGDPEKTRKVRDLLPDATFTTWERAGLDLRSAIAEPPIDPVVPGAMAAYTGSPLPKKLGIGERARIALLAAPKGFEASLAGLPVDARVVRDFGLPADVVLLFARSAAELEKAFAEASEGLAERGKLWICWPKRASGVESDLSQTAVRAFGLARGFVDYKISAIDATWSGLCFARRSG